MEELKNNKLVWVVAAMLVFNVLGFLITTVVADIAADKAIEKLQMEYSPAKPPYGPGLDPDRISIKRHDDNRRSPVMQQIDMTQARDALWRHGWDN